MAEFRLNDFDTQMAAIEILKETHYSKGSTPRRWRTGRIEKPRSQQSSPAIDYRRRAYSTARNASNNHYASSNGQIQAPRQTTRPFSWGPTTATAMRVPVMDYLASPAASSYVSTPNYSSYSSYTSTPFQYPVMQSMYHDVSAFTATSNRTASVASASSCYSDKSSYSPNSPAWIHQKHAVAQQSHDNNESIYKSPESTSFWRYPTLPQVESLQSHRGYMPASHPTHEVSQGYHACSGHLTNLAYHSDCLPDRPPSPDRLWSGKKADDGGEILVALGLYDAPDEWDSPTDAPRKLKLAETWQPPSSPAPEEDASSGEEEGEAEDLFSKPVAGTSWFL